MKRLTTSIIFSTLLLAAGMTLPANDLPETKRSFKFTYKITVNNIAPDADRLEIFAPVPQSTDYQKIRNLKVTAGHNYEFKKDPVYKNRYVYLNLNNEDVPQQFTLKITFNATRNPVLKNNQYAKSNKNLHHYLKPDSLIPLDSLLKKEAYSVSHPKMSPPEKADTFYNYLVQSMDYDKSGQGWGRGDALFACTKKRGNCTDFHSLFIGMNRIMDIPARFKIGFPLPPDKKKGKIGGYHCWAEYYIPEKGWVPVDASEAHKHPEKREFFHGSLDANRIQLTQGRDIPIKAADGKVHRLNYFIYPFVLVDGNVHTNKSTQFSFKEVAGQ